MPASYRCIADLPKPRSPTRIEISVGPGLRARAAVAGGIIATMPTARRALRGRRGITADTALRIARWLDTSPQMWLNLQAIHGLRKVEDEAGETIRQQVTPLRHAG